VRFDVFEGEKAVEVTNFTHFGGEGKKTKAAFSPTGISLAPQAQLGEGGWVNAGLPSLSSSCLVTQQKKQL
jgi:hypothetical protein